MANQIFWSTLVSSVTRSFTSEGEKSPPEIVTRTRSPSFRSLAGDTCTDDPYQPE
jgi:hypothetical protein